MPRNRQERGVSSFEYQMIDKVTGLPVINQTIFNEYTSKDLSRPDAQPRAKVNGFRNPTSWYVSDIKERPFWEGTWYQEDRYTRYQYSGELLGNLSETFPWRYDFPTNTRSRAEVQCLLKVKNQKVSLTTAAAEMHKTVATVGNRLNKLGQAVLAAKRFQFAKAAKLLGVEPSAKLKKLIASNSKNASQGWLELTYGWLPMLQDIDGAHSLYFEKRRLFGEMISAKSTVKSTQRKYYTSALGGRFDATVYDDIEFTCVVALHYRVRNEDMALQAQNGTGELLPTLWELTPWSFLIDWLVPIGNWLQALDAVQGLDFVAGSLTEVTRVTRVGTATGIGDNHGNLTYSGSAMIMDRTLYSSSPIPGLYYKNPLSGAHALNALALLVSNLKIK